MVADSVRPRNFVILCDGTGKNGALDSARNEPVTNVWRLYQAIKSGADGDTVEYYPGVGAENEKVTTSDILARTFGHTAVLSIRSIYLSIARQYQDGDSLSLFGYSRGAFVVSKVACLIEKLGLITNASEFNRHWKSLEHKLPGNRNPALPTHTRRVPISCLGVWDIVGAIRPRVIRKALDLLTLPDDHLPHIVESALHVVAYHENRRLFDATLFKDADSQERCQQTCFPGSHSDVGGGGIELKTRANPLPDITLKWMIDNMPKTIRTIGLDRLSAVIPNDTKLNSAFHDSPLWKRLPDGHQTRKYLPDLDDLVKHRSLLSLPSPGSPYLLSHDWELVEYPPEEEENVLASTKPSVLRRLTTGLTIKPKAAVPHPAVSLTIQTPPVPEHTLRPVTNHTDTASTGHTDNGSDAPDTASTVQTSVHVAEPIEEEECPDIPSERASIAAHEPMDEKSDPPAEKTSEPEPEPVPAQVTSPPPPPAPSSAEQPQMKKKKGLVRRVRGFIRKTLCAGR